MRQLLYRSPLRFTRASVRLQQRPHAPPSSHPQPPCKHYHCFHARSPQSSAPLVSAAAQPRRGFATGKSDDDAGHAGGLQDPSTTLLHQEAAAEGAAAAANDGMVEPPERGPGPLHVPLDDRGRDTRSAMEVLRMNVMHCVLCNQVDEATEFFLAMAKRDDLRPDARLCNELLGARLRRNEPDAMLGVLEVMSEARIRPNLDTAGLVSCMLEQHVAALRNAEAPDASATGSAEAKGAPAGAAVSGPSPTAAPTATTASAATHKTPEWMRRMRAWLDTAVAANGWRDRLAEARDMALRQRRPRTIPVHDVRKPVSQQSMEAALDEDEGFWSAWWAKSPSFSPSDPDVQRQVALETRAMQLAAEQYQDQVKNLVSLGKGAAMTPLQRLNVSWFHPLVVAIAEDQRAINNSESGPDRRLYGPEIVKLDASKLAVITIHETLGQCMMSPTEGAKVARVTQAIGAAVQAEINLERMEKERKDMLRDLRASGQLPTVAVINRRARRSLSNSDWSVSLQAKVGGALLHLLLTTAVVSPTMMAQHQQYGSHAHMDLVQPYAPDEDPSSSSSDAFKPRPLADTAMELEQWMADTSGIDASDASAAPLRSNSDSLGGAAVPPSLRSPAGDGDDEGWASVSSTPALPAHSHAQGGSDTAASPAHVASRRWATASSQLAHDGGPPDAGEVMMDDDTRAAVEGRSDAAVPAFYQVYRKKGRSRVKRVGYVRCHAAVLTHLGHDHQLRETLHARYLPMVCEPRPWDSPQSGGYLSAPVSLMRVPQNSEQFQLLRRASLDAVYRGLDVLSRTGWAVNDRVLDVQNEAWAAGGGLADLPSHRNEPIPPPPEDFVEDASQRRRYRALVQRVIQANGDLHSLRCDTAYKLAVANEFRLEPAFYFPHNLDFRGRAYPIPPHLNQMGSDQCRGLLQFAETRPLGKDGLFWLKVHMANICGHSKASFQDRASWVEQRLSSIIDSADRPLDGHRWWLHAEDPWQCLAACMELAAAVRHPRPEEFESALPVHQDGSCNGLQHYAALGGDVFGATEVNLIPGSQPADVYAGVAALVGSRVAADAAAGNEVAALLEGLVERKIIKQTVMTSVYGVTFVGARQQIMNAMRKSRKFEAMDRDVVYKCGVYLAQLTFEALQEMFEGARNIMSWLTSVARLVAHTGKPVAWETPLGLPVVQPYRRLGSSAVRTLVQTIVLEDVQANLPIDIPRQTSAFPPNFVHSLDSTHMLLTALEVDRAGVPFSSVHDSFWCHAANVPTMSTILREQFVAMHKEPILQNLLSSLEYAHPSVDFPPVPKRGDLDLDQVLQSPYFFH